MMGFYLPPMEPIDAATGLSHGDRVTVAAWAEQASGTGCVRSRGQIVYPGTPKTHVEYDDEPGVWWAVPSELVTKL